MPFEFRTLALGAALMMGTATVTAAQDTEAQITKAGFIEEVGASERINFSGKLRMLSQRIPAAACYAHAGIEKEASTELLEVATAEFDLILKGLEFGEESLGMIGAEKDRKVLMDIKELHTHWDPLHVDIEDIIANGGTDEEVIHIAAESREALRIAKHLVSVIVAEYADPTALLQADALTIDIAGRQRMLAQRISKEVCLLHSNIEPERAKASLIEARDLFHASVNALRHGMPAAGINGTDNPEILTKLDDVIVLWNDVQPVLDRVKASETLSDVQQGYLFHSMNKLTGKMNTIVGLYNDDSKLGL